MRDVLQQTVKSRVESAFGKPKLNTKIILKESKSTYILESVENAPPPTAFFTKQKEYVVIN